MPSRFAHLEILGPRADLDRWLACLQDLGLCHVADAMHGLEGEPRIGRPAPTPDEVRAQRIRSDAGRALRAVAHVLPLSPSRLPERPTPEERRPDWRIGFDGGVLEEDLVALRDEAHEIAGALRHALERVSVAEHASTGEREARAELQDVLARDGGRGRFLLDSINDADRRFAVHDRLAATDHVVAARVYTRPEEAERLRTELDRAFGAQVVVRPLDETDDTPTLPKRLAPFPFAVLSSLTPARLGDVGLASVLALAAPLVTAFLWADIAGGLLLIGIGALLGARAGPGSPRRDTAVLAQLAGLVALVTGVCVGRMFGPAGHAWFGTGWGLFETDRPFADMVGPLRIALVLGLVAGALALYAAGVLFSAHTRGQVGRRDQAAGFALAAVAACAIALTPHAAWLAVIALLAAIGFWAMRGLRALFFQFGLDLVGFARLVAVGAVAVLLADATFHGWIEASLAAILLAPVTLAVAALAIVADPAYVAMGVPYEVALGGHQLSHPFVPFARTLRGVESEAA